MEGLYELGLLDYDSDSSFDLISKMSDKEYYLNKFKQKHILLYMFLVNFNCLYKFFFTHFR